jgi:hypothetical protein
MIFWLSARENLRTTSFFLSTNAVVCQPVLLSWSGGTRMSLASIFSCAPVHRWLSFIQPPTSWLVLMLEFIKSSDFDISLFPPLLRGVFALELLLCRL